MAPKNAPCEYMKNIDTYKSWRDKLLSMVSNNICMSCTDKRKEQYNINYENPLLCDCHCHRVENILEHVRNINEELERSSKEK